MKGEGVAFIAIFPRRKTKIDKISTHSTHRGTQMDTTMFSTYPSQVSDLLLRIETGEIALPDLQRPFVWKDVKVRNLLDSMNKGFPVGFVMLWHFPDNYSPVSRSSAIGTKGPQPIRSLLIDGQQRLTALLSALDGVTVKDKEYRDRRIRISFSPLAKADDGRPIGRFEVWSNATEKDPEWISDISVLYRAPENVFSFCRNYISDINASREKKNLQPLTEAEQDLVFSNINNLLGLRNYNLPTVAINSSASEEDVAEIFVRVNSGGQQLMEKNFIETLLAVYDNDILRKITQFCESARIPQDKSAYNPIIKPEPAHLIRAAVAVGFDRARLKYAYMLMRGRDLTTGVTSQETQAENLEKFRNAMEQVTNLNNWHDFLNLFPAAGYLNDSLVTSANAVVYSYALYLIGKYKFKVPALKLRRAMTRYIFTVTVNATYSGSSETYFEGQLNDIKGRTTADDFLSYIDEFVATIFTESYFTVTLPAELKTSSTKAPTWCAFVAAQNVLGSQVWLGTTAISSLLSVGSSGTKRAYDKHHIFPKNYLKANGINKDVECNQVANFVFLDYPTNIEISDQAPGEYAPHFRKKLGEDAFRRSCEANAIPDDFWMLPYPEFLKARRMLMAQTIHSAYDKLSKNVA